MHIGAVIPHLLKFGGVRRFLELGNVFFDMGHKYTLFVEHLDPPRWPRYPDWFGSFRPEIRDWSEVKADVVIIGDPPSLAKIHEKVQGRIFVYVIGGGHYTAQYQEFAKKYPVILNNRCFAPFYPGAPIVEGGVNVKHFKRQNQKIRVGYQTGRGNKGVEEIEEALQGLDNVQLVKIEGYNNDTLPFVYGSLDYFIVNQKHFGWPNMAIEAMACHVPVVCMDFHSMVPVEGLYIQPENVRAFFENPMGEFAWERVATKLLEVFHA